MQRVQECRENAARCLAMAEQTNDPKSKTLLVEMAQGWLRLKDEYIKRAPAEVRETIAASAWR
jgi:hypothetical protein